MIIIVGDEEVEEPPIITPPPIVHPEFGLGITLVGTDGTVWDLASGPVYALSGTSALGAPDVDVWWKEVAAFNGSTYKGYRIPARPVDLPLEVNPATNGDDWLVIDRALWAGLNPSREVNLYVTTPDGKWRYLTMRRLAGGNEQWDIEPMIFGSSVYPLTFMAGDPFWKSARVSIPFEVSNDDAFFPGPPFNINPGNAVATAAVTNPGEVDAWPRWVIDGPYTEASVGVGASLVTLSTPILAGDQRIIDMDPQRRTITDDDGVDAWLEVTAANFAAIPAGTEVPLSLTLTGPTSASRINLSFDPRYYRAW